MALSPDGIRAYIAEAIASPAGALPRRRIGYSDIVLAIAAVTIVGVMILPLPLVAIDILVAINIAIGFSLLLVSIYIPTPVAFSSFPSVLLLTTLFRLAISIAVTRSILLHAEAGHIVDTFGSMVAGGNLVVGLVVFLIITVVQFIVIAKGAERVAEVSARFTLDAMPGKQLSIDSDLRSGLIDKDEVRRRRRHLEIESQLHGSLDGAMKFVKGDAIAGIVIIIINLLGGLAIGVLQRDMPLADAAHTYSILTIGDGLVSQIPAILSTIAAGLVVTRTTGDVEDRHLGDTITRQVSGQPRVLLITGCLAMLMVLVPGFPKIVFALLGTVLLSISAWRYRHEFGLLRRAFRVPADEYATHQQPVVVDDLSPLAPLQLDLSPALAAAMGEAAIRAHMTALAKSLREEYGVPVPNPELRTLPRLAGDGEYQLSAFGVRIASGLLRGDSHFLPAVDGNGAVDGFVPPLTGSWVAAAGEGTMSPADLLVTHTRRALLRNLGKFIGIQETTNLFVGMQRDYPDLIKEMLRVVSPQRVADVLRRLAEECIPIRNLRDVFEAITDAGGREKDVMILTEQVRVALKREIVSRYSGAERTLHVLMIDPQLEDTLRESVRMVGGVPQIAVAPEFIQMLGKQLSTHLPLVEGSGPPVLLCSIDVRRYLRKLVEIEFFDFPVLSYQELSSDVHVVQLGKIHT